MNGQRRFSAAPVNFNRFVSLHRSASRSLSPDRELHQMLRPYQRHGTPLLTFSSAAVTATAVPAVAGTRGRHKAERRSADMVMTTSGVVITTAADGAVRQAATSPSRSVSGGAAATAAHAPGTASSPAISRAAPRHYYEVEDEAEEENHGSLVPEEVDLLLRAVQQLGSPLYDPVTQRFLCWNHHVLERRSRASYGDIDGVSCDFCGHTDWLESMASTEDDEKEHQLASSPASPKQQQQQQQQRRGSVVKQEDEDDSRAAPHSSATRGAHHRYLYHCPVCAVDICAACLAEVRADERLHVPCLQCHRCGAFEMRRDAPVHQCRPKHAKVEPLAEAKAQVGLSWRLPLPASVSAATAATQRLMKEAPYPIEAEAPIMPLQRETAVVDMVICDASRSEQGQETYVLSPESSFAAGAPLDVSAGAGGQRQPRIRHGVSHLVAGDENLDEEERLVVGASAAAPAAARLDVSPQRRRLQGAMPPRVSQARSDPAPPQSAARVLIPALARYEVQLRPRSGEEVEEVHRIAREQHLHLLPPPAPGKVSVAYFPTRLAAESCVERAAAGSVEALLKRFIRGE